MKKKYIFVLCPPYQGSTMIVNLLDSSKKVSTLLPMTRNGETQHFIRYFHDDIYYFNKWNPEYDLNIEYFKDILDNLLDNNASVFVEKSPPNICRAKKFEEYFSMFGEVHFIISIRNPYSTNYSAEKWVEYAKYQKKNIESLSNTIVTSYENICLNLDNFISVIKEKFPELNDIHNRDNDICPSYERLKKIHSEHINRVLDKEKKNTVLQKNLDLLNYFGYTIIE